jgi:hypothetical protein
MSRSSEPAGKSQSYPGWEKWAGEK